MSEENSEDCSQTFEEIFDEPLRNVIEAHCAACGCKIWALADEKNPMCWECEDKINEGTNES